MIDRHPTQQEAQAALTEASSQAAQVRRADREFKWMLLVIAALYLSVAVVISAAGRRGGPIAVFALLALLITAVIAFIWLGLRFRAYSRTGILWYLWSVAAFNIGNAILVGVSIASGFWGPTQPTYHFGLTVLVAVIPLLVAAYIISRR